MKSNILRLMWVALLPCFMGACVDNIPEEEVLPRDAVSFEYYIDQKVDSIYYLDYYVDSDITFVNTSPESTVGTPTWDFGDGTESVIGGDTAIHYFTEAGTYKVRLTIGTFSKVQVVMIAPIKPIVTIEFADSVCEVRQTAVSFKVDLPNPKNKPAHFSWTFPKDTKDTLGANYLKHETDLLTDLPEPVKFWHVGSQEVKLNVTLNGEALEETSVNVQVAYDKAVPTLYYAVQGGNIMAYKLTGGSHNSNMQINPFDLGVSAGQHPFNILFNDSVLYLLDAGQQFYYVNDVNGVMGDGKISVVAKDGSKVETMISNVGQAAFDDPFFGFVDSEAGYLYYANRNTGIMKVKVTDRDKLYNITEYPYWVRHNHLHYYRFGLAYGAVSNNFAKINGIWHWSICHTATGTLCFMEDDILKDPVSQGDKASLPEEGIILEGVKIRSFVCCKDSTPTNMDDNIVVFCAMESNANVVAACTYKEWKAMDSQGAVAKKSIKYNTMEFASNMDGNLPASEGTGVESVGITQMVYDEVNGCVYFAYRNTGKKTEGYPNSGIYSYRLSDGKVTCLIDGVKAYGVTINNKPSKLF